MAEHEADPEHLADELEEKTDELENRSEKLKSEISDARTGWESKRSDPGVPGAAPPATEEQANSDDDSDEREDKTQGNDDA